MRLHLVTVEGTQRFEDTWKIAPLVRLLSLSSHGRALMLPMSGDEVELRLPGWRATAGHIVSFGMSVWQDSDGMFYMNMDPSDPYVALSITDDSNLAEIPVGTEIWLPHAKTSPA